MQPDVVSWEHVGSKTCVLNDRVLWVTIAGEVLANNSLD